MSGPVYRGGPTPQNATATLRILWGALCLSQLLLAFVAYQTTKALDPNPGNPETLALMRTLGAFAFAIAIFMPRFLWKRSFKGKNLSGGEATRLLTPGFIIRMAFFESVSLYGFVAAQQVHDVGAMLPFLIVGLVAGLLNYPSDSKLEAWSNYARNS